MKKTKYEWNVKKIDKKINKSEIIIKHIEKITELTNILELKNVGK